MNRYFARIRMGYHMSAALVPLEIPEGSSFKEEAVDLARDLLAEAELLGLDQRECGLEIEDKAGQVVLSFRFVDLPVPDLSENELIPRMQE